MGVEGSKRGLDSRIRDLLHVHGIHIVLLDLFQNEIQFAPLRISPVDTGMPVPDGIYKASAQHPEKDTEHSCQ